MGALFFFDKTISSNDNKGNKSNCAVEVVDNHGIPEVRIGPEGEAYKGYIAEFTIEELCEFANAIDNLRSRLSAK